MREAIERLDYDYILKNEQDYTRKQQVLDLYLDSLKKDAWVKRIMGLPFEQNKRAVDEYWKREIRRFENDRKKLNGNNTQ